MPTKLTQIIPFFFVWLWSTGFINARYAIPYIEPFYFLAIRFSLTILAFLLLVYVLKKNWPSRRDAKVQIAIGFLLHGAYLGGVFLGVHLGMPAGVTSIFVGLHPALTAVLSWALLKGKLQQMQSIGLALGFVGICMVILGSQNIDGSALSTIGIFACIISLFGISVGGLLQKTIGGDAPFLSGTLCQYVGGLIVVVPLSLMLETHEIIWSFEFVAALIWSVIMLSVVAILLFLYMIREGEVAKVASYFYLVPPAAVLQSWFLFDEKLGFLAITGCLLAVMGVYFVTKKATS